MATIANENSNNNDNNNDSSSKSNKHNADNNYNDSEREQQHLSSNDDDNFATIVKDARLSDSNSAQFFIGSAEPVRLQASDWWLTGGLSTNEIRGNCNTYGQGLASHCHHISL